MLICKKKINRLSTDVGGSPYEYLLVTTTSS